jgi:TRAP-type mannitol/chloroaromatic compound transport system permease small subunit
VSRRQFGFVFYLIIIIKVIISSQVSDEGVDDTSTIVLASLWSLLHVVLLLSTKFPIFVNKHARAAS